MRTMIKPAAMLAALALVAVVAGCGKTTGRHVNVQAGEYYTQAEIDSLSNGDKGKYCSDLEAEKTVLLEAGFDELHGVSWSKGCYMGQELTARTNYRGLVKRRLLPVAIEGPLPPPGSPVLPSSQRSSRNAA